MSVVSKANILVGNLLFLVGLVVLVASLFTGKPMGYWVTGLLLLVLGFVWGFAARYFASR